MGMSTSGPSLARHLHGHDRLGPGDRGMPSIGKGKAGERTLLYPSGEAGDIELILARRYVRCMGMDGCMHSGS